MYRASRGGGECTTIGRQAPGLPIPDSHPSSTFSVEFVQSSEVEAVVLLSGSLRFAEAERVWSELREIELRSSRGQTLHFDMTGVQVLDGGAMALLAHLRAGLHRRGVTSEFTGASERVQDIISLYGGDLEVVGLKRRKAESTFAHVGRSTVEALLELKSVLAFFGEMLVTGAALLRRPASANWRDLSPTMERAGADALPIVMLINFLVGLAMAFQSSTQLKQFGAEILVADLIGISVTRELGPLMTAIIVCGRSGAAFAAELGFMKVNEEIDALRTMGFGPMRYLVLPRTLALILVVPMLTLVADLSGVLGGLVVGVFNLDLTLTSYVYQTVNVVTLWDVSSGVIKSVLFAMAISLIACQQGLATSGGAEGVGRRTTSAVVSTLFTLILIDASATVFFRVAGL